jgi:hypothetical protein
VSKAETSEPPSLNAKVDFSKLIYLLPSDALGRVVQVLTTSCDKALNQISPDEMEILVDEIDPETFWELDSFVKKNIPADKVASSKKTKRQPEEVSAGSNKKKKLN